MLQRAIPSLIRAELINVAKTAGATDDNHVRDLLQLLAVDHYWHMTTPTGRYSFRMTCSADVDHRTRAELMASRAFCLPV